MLRVQDNPAQYHYDQGNKFLYAGRKAQAVTCFDEAIRKKPDYAEAYFGKAKALDALGQSLDALQCYDEAIARNSNYSDAY
jgi:tetratricopeptide (TPR) repeat protein